MPDMANSIWSGIEAQLDAPVDAPAPDKKPSPRFKGKGGYGIAGIAATVVFIGLLWWYHNHTKQAQKNTTPPAQTIPAAKDSLSPAADSSAPVNDKKKNMQAAPGHTQTVPPAIQPDTLPFNNTPSNHHLDSAAIPPQPSPKMDSLLLPTNRPAAPAVDSVNTPLPAPGKKPKGVKGITSEDYRLSVGKDSARKKH